MERSVVHVKSFPKRGPLDSNFLYKLGLYIEATILTIHTFVYISPIDFGVSY